MPRVVGIDLGTHTIDCCGIEDGQPFFEASMPTATALTDPAQLIDRLLAAGPLDLVVGPSGYGLPVTRAQDLTETVLRLASLAADGEGGGISGFRALLRAFASSSLPVVLTPGVVHLPSVPAHRKVNRVDMGTADKVCACALGIYDRARQDRCLESDVSFILLEMGGAFTAGIAVQHGQIVDGAGGTSGPLGMEAAGALDGEVAFLADHVSKQMLFTGGASSISGSADTHAGTLATPLTVRGRLAWEAFIEGAVKAVAALAVSTPGVRHLMLSGRLAHEPLVREELTRRIAPSLGKLSIRALTGFTAGAKQGAQGAALIADGLAGGACADLVRTLGIQAASGTVLDHLYVISADSARARLGID